MISNRSGPKLKSVIKNHNIHNMVCCRSRKQKTFPHGRKKKLSLNVPKHVYLYCVPDILIFYIVMINLEKMRFFMRIGCIQAACY